MILLLACYLLKTLTQHISQELEWSFFLGKKLQRVFYTAEFSLPAILLSLIKMHVGTIYTKVMYLSKLLPSSGKTRIQ